MYKRGQVSVFAIVGIVIVILIMLVYFLNDQGVIPLFGKQDFLNTKLDPMQDEINRCTDLAVQQGLVLLGKQGGDFNPSSYLKYQGQNVRYYCLTQNGEKYSCTNNMPFLEDIQKSFRYYLFNQLEGCINTGVFDDGWGYYITVGKKNVSATFDDNSIEIDVDYQVSVKKDDIVVNLPVIKRIIPNTPIKSLYNVAYDIVDTKAKGYYFDQLIYMLDHKGEFVINVEKPYPDTIYKINKKDSDFEFWFATQGVEEYIA